MLAISAMGYGRRIERGYCVAARSIAVTFLGMLTTVGAVGGNAGLGNVAATGFALVLRTMSITVASATRSAYRGFSVSLGLVVMPKENSILVYLFH